MANGHRQSRSPVRALTTIDHPGDDPRRHAPHSHERPPLAGGRPLAFVPGGQPMCCPECGTALRLQLGTAPAAPSGGRDEDDRGSDEPGLRAASDASGGPPARERPGPLPDFESTIKDYKRRLIRRALEENGDVMTRAAKALGLKYTTFVAMAHRLDVVEKDGAGNGGRDQR